MSLLLAVGAAGGPVTATLTQTEQNDTLSSSADLFIQAALTATEANDSLSSSADLFIQATLSSTEANDSLSSTAVLPIQASLTATEANDSLSSTATVGAGSITANLTATESDDSLVSTASVSNVIALVGDGGSGEPTDEEVIAFLEYLKHKKKKKSVAVVKDIVEELENSVFAEEVQQIIQESVVTTERQKPVINYQAILNDIESLKALIELYQQYLEEEELMVLLLAA